MPTRFDDGPIMGRLKQRVNLPVLMLRPAIGEEGANRCEESGNNVEGSMDRLGVGT